MTEETNSALHMRIAKKADLPCIVRLLADDVLGAERECVQEPLLPSYFRAFAAIEADQNNELIVACIENDIVGVLQITYIPHLNYQGSWRALIESVRIDSGFRSRGLGKRLLEWAIARARERGCRMVQLTTDKQRTKAKQFYESVGFVDSHEGMKFSLIPES